MPNNLPKHLRTPAERLQWLRARAGLSGPKEAAEKYGFNLNTYKSHENGTRGITERAAVKYAKVYKVPMIWLLHGTALAPADLTEEERELLAKFRRLPPNEQRTAQMLVETLDRATAERERAS